MKKRSTSLQRTLASLTSLALCVPLALSAQADDGNRSPFKACQNVPILSAADYARAGSPAGTQAMPDVGLFVTRISPADLAAAGGFAHQVAQTYLDHLQSKQAYLQSLLRCFTGDAACNPKDRQDLLNAIAEGAPKLRQELALAKNSVETADGGGLTLDDPASHLNRGLLPFGLLPDPFAGAALSDDEYAQALATFTREQTQLKAEAAQAQAAQAASARTATDAALINTVTGPRLLAAAYARYQQKHQAIYRELVFERYPIFAALPRLAPGAKPAGPGWNDAQIAQAITRLQANAQTEAEITRGALTRGTLEFARWDGERIGRSLVKGQRDLLDYIVFTPVVEDVLAAHPESCGMATGLSTHLANRDAQNAILTNAGLLALGAVSGGLGIAAKAGAVGARAVQAATLTSVGIGLGTTAAFYADTYQGAATAQRSVVNRTGANPAREPVDGDFHTVEAAQAAFVQNAALSALGASDVLVIGKALANVAMIGAQAARTQMVAAMARYRGTPADLERAALATRGLPDAAKAPLHAAIAAGASDVQGVRDELVPLLTQGGRPDLLTADSEATLIPLVYQVEKEDGIAPAEVDNRIRQTLASPSCAIKR